MDSLQNKGLSESNSSLELGLNLAKMSNSFTSRLCNDQWLVAVRWLPNKFKFLLEKYQILDGKELCVSLLPENSTAGGGGGGRELM